MVDLNNTWCEATEENEKILNALGFHIVGMQYDGKIINVNRITYYFGGVVQEDRKQIHLVNGEFEYVDDKYI